MKIVRYILWSFVTLAGVSFAGCQADTDTHPEPQPVKGVIAVQAQSEMDNESNPTSESGRNTKSNDNETLTYVLEVWTREAEARRVLHKAVNGGLTSGAEFDITLIPGIYDFLFWADYGNGHYVSTDLRKVTVATEAYRPDIRNDAFACVLKEVDWNENTSYNATLKRCVALMNIHNTAAFDKKNAVTMVYNGLYRVYDVLTQEVSDPLYDLRVSFPETTVGSTLIGEDFFFVPAEGDVMSFSVSVGDVTKSLDDVPLKSNYSTNITCSLQP